MDIEKWSKKAKIAGMTIITTQGLVISGHIDAQTGIWAIAVVACVYLVCQGLVDMRK